MKKKLTNTEIGEYIVSSGLIMINALRSEERVCYQLNRGAILSYMVLLIAIMPSLMLQKSHASPYEIKLSHATSSNTPTGKMAEKLTDLVERSMDRKVRIEVFSDGTLFTSRRVVQALLLGDVQMAVVPTEHLYRYSDAIKAISRPFQFDRLEDIEKIRDSNGWKNIIGQLERSGIVMLGLIHRGQKILLSPNSYHILDPEIVSSGVSGTWNEYNSGPDLKEATWLDLVDTRYLNLRSLSVIETNHRYSAYAVISSAEFWYYVDDGTRQKLSSAISEAIKYGNDAYSDATEKVRDEFYSSGAVIIGNDQHEIRNWLMKIREECNKCKVTSACPQGFVTVMKCCTKTSACPQGKIFD